MGRPLFAADGYALVLHRIIAAGPVAWTADVPRCGRHGPGAAVPPCRVRREESNRPLLRGLYGLARVAHWQERWNCAEMILMRLLYLDPVDEQQAGVLLREVRAAAGIVQPDETA
ncbi:hypothetical protein ABR737_00325 [Streptomyces sp. Edi2]|uniref:hypothetical protein n=1 Tax=Streptomyces sp. Edi2 TaxID=3162528 RepID=UPI0033063A4E